jgi:hypothetical protein
VATQAFGLGADGDSERLFKSTVRWLMRDWVCENLEVLVTGAGALPGTGRVGEALTYRYRVSQSGACAAIGVVLSEELPPGWVVAGVETTAGSWEQVGPWLATTVGCMDVAGAAEVEWRLIPTRPGTYTHRVTLAAAREDFNADKHVVETTTVVEGGELAPRLELRAAVTGGGWELWVFGTAGTAYRVEHTTALRDPAAGTVWELVGTVNGPQGKVVWPGRAGDTHYFRAVWP